MTATLCSYECFFGPRHPQTLALMSELAIALFRHGKLLHAQLLMERSVREIASALGREHEMRLRILATLRDLLLQQGDYGRAGAVQREIWDCQAVRLGIDHPDTREARDYFSTLLLMTQENPELQSLA
jgi:hypothetical protein